MADTLVPRPLAFSRDVSQTKDSASNTEIDPGVSERTQQQPQQSLVEFQSQRSPSSSNAELLKEQQQSLDSEKQVVSSEESSGSGNAPMIVTEDSSPQALNLPVREADKMVVSSWQSSSREENAPIPMAYHYGDREESAPIPVASLDDSPSQSNLLNDIKGPPPDYEKDQRNRSTSDVLLASHSPIEPDSPTSTLLPKPEDRTAVGQLLSWVPSPPTDSKRRKTGLVQPVVIPQLDIPPKGESVPFTRCYSDALAACDVPMREFLAFLDGLALAQAPGAALQGLKLFGVGARSVPIPLIPLAGRGISALATSGSGHSSSRARLYLERAKKEYFAPRGLSLAIVRDGDLSSRLQIPSHAARLAPLTKNSMTETSCRRRLNGLAPYVAPLKFNVSEPDKQLQGVHKMARKHLDSRFKDQAKRLSKLREEQWQDVSAIWSEMAGWEEDYTFKMGQIRRLQDDIMREQAAQRDGIKSEGDLNGKIDALQNLQRQIQILESQRYMAIQNSVGKSKGVRAEVEEVELSGRLKWIVIEELQS